MYVEMFAEITFAHGGALDVPARPAGSPRGFPRWFTRLGRFPQYEIERIALVAVNLDSFTGSKIVKGLARKLSVAFELTNRIKHIAIGSAIRDTLVNQLLDKHQHLRNVFRGARLDVRFQDIQGGSVLIH